MTEREHKNLKNWEKKRKRGKWNYIAVYGGLFMIVMLLFRNGSDYFSDKLPLDFLSVNDILKQLVTTGIGGFIYGLVTWFMQEKSYRRLLKIQTDESNS